MTIRIVKTSGNWTVRAAGSVIGASTQAVELIEDGSDPVIYFPRSDVAMAFLEPSDKKTTCPQKGVASYYSIATVNRTLENAVWSYEAPKEAAKQIEGYLAFQPGEFLKVERA